MGVGIAARFAGNVGRFNEMCGQFNENAAYFNGTCGRFNENTARFNEMCGRFNENAARFNGLAGRFNGIATLFNENAGRFNVICRRFNEKISRFIGNYRKLRGNLIFVSTALETPTATKCHLFLDNFQCSSTPFRGSLSSPSVSSVLIGVIGGSLVPQAPGFSRISLSLPRTIFQFEAEWSASSRLGQFSWVRSRAVTPAFSLIRWVMV